MPPGNRLGTSGATSNALVSIHLFVFNFHWKLVPDSFQNAPVEVPLPVAARHVSIPSMCYDQTHSRRLFSTSRRALRSQTVHLSAKYRTPIVLLRCIQILFLNRLVPLLRRDCTRLSRGHIIRNALHQCRPIRTTPHILQKSCPMMAMTRSTYAPLAIKSLIAQAACASIWTLILVPLVSHSHFSTILMFTIFSL